MSYEFIKVEKKNRLSIITINRPDVLNALHPPACRELDEAFNQFSADPETWLAILTGAGEKAFCAGNDLKWQAKHGGEAVREGLNALKGGFGGITRRFDFFKPLIAAVNGFALGGGFELALACDIIIAVEHATFGLPEPRVGMIAGAGGVHRLPRQIPYHLAMGLLLTGRRITAQEALKMGIINEVVPAEELKPAVERWTADILECAPLALRASKSAAFRGLELSLYEAIDTPFKEIIDMRQSEDFEEGPRAFAQKRKPIWKGR